MAEEKKPKIDLKARLGKNQAAAPPPTAGVTPPPAAVGAPVPAPSSSPTAPTPGVPVPVPAPSASVVGGGLPVPPGMKPAAAPALDPSNPLAAVVQPYRAPAPPAPAAPPQPQRIEVDEVAVKDARGKALRQGILVGVVMAAITGVVGFIGGGARETSQGRAKSIEDANGEKGLSKDVKAARDQIKTISDKMEAGRNTLVKDKKFPNDLAKELAGINVDFDGGKLAGRRFSGYNQETMSALIEFITAVQTLNDRKLAIANLLGRLQKPLTEQLANAGKPTLQHVVVIDKEKDGPNFAILAPLKEPLPLAPLPSEFTFTDPFSRQPKKLNRYTGGDLSKPVAFHVVPKSVDAVCPNETAGQAAQLASQIGKFIADIQGEKVDPKEAMVQEPKAGLLERADKLIGLLEKVGK